MLVSDVHECELQLVGQIPEELTTFHVPNTVTQLIMDAKAAEARSRSDEGMLHRVQPDGRLVLITDDDCVLISAIRTYYAATAQYEKDVARCRASCLHPYLRSRPLSSQSSLRARDVLVRATRLQSAVDCCLIALIMAIALQLSRRMC